MKHPGTEYWGSPNTGATNSSGLTALPGGLFYNGNFQGLNGAGHWWSSTQYVEEVAWWRYFSYNESKLHRLQQPKSYGLSVRCIKD